MLLRSSFSCGNLRFQPLPAMGFYLRRPNDVFHVSVEF